MVFRDLSVQRFDLLAGGFGLRSALCQLDTFAHSYGLERTPLSGEVERAKPDDAVDLAGSCTAGPRLLVNAERLECDVDFLLVPRLRVCIPPAVFQACWEALATAPPLLLSEWAAAL